MAVLTSSEGPAKLYIKPIVVGQFLYHGGAFDQITRLLRHIYNGPFHNAHDTFIQHNTLPNPIFSPLDAVSKLKKREKESQREREHVYFSLNIPPLIFFHHT